MDKKIIILGLLLLISFTLLLFMGIRLKNIESNANILKKYYVNKNTIPEKGLVADKETAMKIAEAVLVPIYGDAINDKKPFDVIYDEINKVWVVKGTLKENEIGGVPNVIIRKIDGKIVAVWHTK